MNGMYLGDNRAMAVTEFGHKVFVDTRDVSIAPHLLADGKWEHWITNVMGPLLRGSYFVDVGANFGWYSLLAAYAEARHISAFEPNPRLFSLLIQTLQVNGIRRVDVHGVAVGDEETTLNLQVDWLRVGGATLLEKRRTMEGWEQLLPEVEQKISVPVVTLDRVITTLFNKQPEIKKAAMVLKVDVEGFEPRAVLGAKTILQEHPNCTAFVEYHSDEDDENKLLEMLQFFEENRYGMGVVTQEAKVVPLNRADLQRLDEAEMLCFQRFPN